MESYGRPSDMIRQMEHMQNEMMKNFGGGMMMRDPFKDDPFFNSRGGGIFDRADNMME
jgi:hypothetical protein